MTDDKKGTPVTQANGGEGGEGGSSGEMVLANMATRDGRDYK